jgi:hypothetical protein
VRSPTAEGNLKRSRSEQRFPKSAIISAFLLARVFGYGCDMLILWFRLGKRFVQKKRFGAAFDQEN